MKPFSLEAAKAGDPIITRDGRKARFIAHVPEFDKGYRIVVAIEGNCSVSEFYESGRGSESRENAYDLFMAPERRTVYVNLYPATRLTSAWDFLGAHYDTAEDAFQNANPDEALAVAVPIEIWE